MTFPTKWVFEINNDQWMQITVQDGLAALAGSTLSITDATVTATLYKNRVVGDPLRPGTVVTSFGMNGSLTLGYVGAGTYRGLITESLNDYIGTNYVVVFRVSTPAGADVQTECRAQLVVRQNG